MPENNTLLLSIHFKIINIAYQTNYMKLKYPIAFLISFIFFTTSTAQNRFYEKGYIVTLKGDTLNGYIKKLRNSLLNNGIDFKGSLQDTIELHYKPDDLKSFYFPSDNLRFEQVVYRDNDKYNTVKKLNGLLLVSGKISLYKLNLMDRYNTTIFEHNNDHIYILKKDTGFTVLRMKEWMDDGKYFLEKDYIVQLEKLVQSCEKVIGVTDDLEFDDKEIQNVIMEFNNCGSNNNSIVYNHKSSLIKKHGLTASYYYLNYETPIQNPNAFSVGYFWDLLDPRFNEFVSLITGINYVKASNTYYFGNNIFSVPILATINLSDKKVAPFINLGTTMYLYASNPSIDFNINVGIGTYIYDKILLSVNYEHQNLSDLFNGDLLKNYWLNLKVGYRLK